MKLIELIIRHCQNIGLKGRLVDDVTLDTGVILKKGTESVLLIDKGDGTFHFEAEDEAFTAKETDFELVKQN